MVDLELRCVCVGVDKPLFLYWDYESDLEQIGFIIERTEKRGGVFRTDYRAADNGSWASSPHIIQGKDFSAVVPAHWGSIMATERKICVRLFFVGGEEHAVEVSLGD